MQEWVSGDKPNYGLYINVGNHTSYLSEAGTDNEPVLFLDCSVPAGKLQFQPGETSKSIPITVIDDGIQEDDETIRLTISNPLHATLGNNTVYTYTIGNNTNQAPTVDAGSDQTITLPAVASLSGSASDDGQPNPPAALIYTWSKVSGPGTVTFGDAAALSTNATFSEAGTYVLQLQASDSILSATDTVTVTVNAMPTVAFSTTSSSGSESATSVNLTVNLSAASSNTVTVDYAATGTATSGTDYTLSGSQLTFAPGVTSQTIPVTVINDSLDENDETIVVTLSSPANAGPRDEHFLHVHDHRRRSGTDGRLHRDQFVRR